jgi:uncharacterized membrane protein YraQ (UPF0718 family)/copper chaperone CopZ
MEILLKILSEFWGVLSEMAPYLLFGFLFAGLLSVFISQRLVERNLGGKGIWPVIKASIFGVPLPLCSCGVIPVAASLRNQGANRSATTSFLLSTPQTGVDSIMVTYSLLGPVFAIFRPIAALLTGILGGSLVETFDRDGKSEPQLVAASDKGYLNSGNPLSKLINALQYGFISLPQDIAKALLVGLAIAAVISFALPDDFFAGLLGTGFWSMLVMMGAGIPVYVCATASVPVAAAFMAKGISAGAALVFLMTGPATNAATIATIWKVLGRKTALIYLATVAGSSLLAGFLLDYIFTFEGIPAPTHSHEMLPGWLNNLSAIALLIILAFALLKPYMRKTTQLRKEMEMSATTLQIKGMTCNHCAANVKRALEGVTGVDSVEVDLQRGKAFIDGEGYSEVDMKQAVEKIGYSIVDK